MWEDRHEVYRSERPLSTTKRFWFGPLSATFAELGDQGFHLVCLYRIRATRWPVKIALRRGSESYLCGKFNPEAFWSSAGTRALLEDQLKDNVHLLRTCDYTFVTQRVLPPRMIGNRTAAETAADLLL